MEEDRCINCNRIKEHPYLWFCDGCTLVKEKSYKDSRDKGENDFVDVIIARDTALSKYRDELKHGRLDCLPA